MDDDWFTITFGAALLGLIGLIDGFFAHKDYCDSFKGLDLIPRTCETGIGILTNSLSAYLLLGFVLSVGYLSWNRFDAWNKKSVRSQEDKIEIINSSSLLPDTSDLPQTDINVFDLGAEREAEIRALLGEAPIAKEEIENKYKKLELIDSGGMAEVFKCMTKPNNKIYVWKQAAPNRFDVLETVNQRLLDEIEILKSIDHPRVPKYIDHGEIINKDGESVVVMIMEFIEGRSLKDDIDTFLRNDKTYTIQQAIKIIQETCEPLEYMANLQYPVYHRDIKPANIIIEPTRGPVLIDFGLAIGLAKAVPAGQDRSLSQGGSEGWSPPERKDGISGPYTDVFSLGQTLWQMLTGERPFHALSKDEIKEKIIEKEHPEWIAEVIHASAERYGRRIQTVFEFRKRLENEDNYQE